MPLYFIFLTLDLTVLTFNKTSMSNYSDTSKEEKTDNL